MYREKVCRAKKKIGLLLVAMKKKVSLKIFEKELRQWYIQPHSWSRLRSNMRMSKFLPYHQSCFMEWRSVPRAVVDISLPVRLRQVHLAPSNDKQHT